MSTIAEILSVATSSDPARDFNKISDDLCGRLRDQGVSSHSLNGVRIAMRIAYRLGERAGMHAMLDAREQR